jgi:pSer/pThr/pTyr-binding forkhead associated (FHA) protein
MSEDPNLYGASVAEPVPVTTAFNNQRGAQPAAASPRLVNLNTNRSFTLKNNRTLLGRAISCDIVLDDLNVSRTHAEIRRESPTLWNVADLGSTNGTLVNGRHIASAVLSEGDRITVGTTTFLFTFE